MGLDFGAIFFLTFLGMGFVALPCLLALRLAPEPKRPRMVRWLAIWGIKGVVLPTVLWAILNLGISLNLQPFMPELQAARNRGGSWFPVYLRVLSLGFYIIGSFWSAATIGWVLRGTFVAAEEKARQDFRSICLACLLALCIPIALILFLGGWPALGLAGTILLAPMAAYSRNVLHPPKLPPMYARAIARMKFGKYAEAEWEIIKELENWEDDFEGWMMLAGLYANQFHNLREAEQTVLELCDQATTTPSQLAVALHRLADWHLKLGQDPDSARRALQMICHRLKGTHLAHMARLRMDQLPASASELREQQGSHSIPLPALGDHLDEPDAAAPDDLKVAKELANACVEQLKQNPNHVAAREKLARLFAERLAQPQLGIEQVQLLLEMPDRSEKERAGWLSLIAAWELKYGHNVERGRDLLARLIREFPNSVEAIAARRRLQLIQRQLEHPTPGPSSSSHA